MVAVSIADLLSSAPLRAHSAANVPDASAGDIMDVEVPTKVKMEIKKEDIIEDYFKDGPASPIRAATPATPATPVVVPATPPFEEIRTIADLHRAVVFEMNRRKVSQSKAAVEANLRELGMGQPALSTVLSVASINNNDRGKQFSEYMVKYVSST